MKVLVDGLRVSHPAGRGARRTVVCDVSLKVRSGAVVSLVGPNGSGKSTLLRATGRLHRPDAGRVVIGGADVWGLRPRHAARRVTLLPQSPVAPEAVTVAGLAGYGRHPHQGLFRQWSAADERATVGALIRTGMADLADRRVDHLSGGQRQRAWLAMIFAQQAPVMLLDEPTSMLDLGHQVEVLDLIRSSGRTVIMVVHDLAQAARYSDVLVAMRDGRVVACGAPREILDADLVRALYDVEADIVPAPGDGSPVVVTRTPAPAERPNASSS